MKAWVEYMRRQAGEAHIWRSGVHFGDWLAFATTAPDYPGATTGKDLIATAFYVHSTDLLRRTAAVLGKRDDATVYVGTPYLCDVLSRYGYTDLAYHLLTRDAYPSWLYPVKQGATTSWSRWARAGIPSPTKSVRPFSVRRPAFRVREPLRPGRRNHGTTVKEVTPGPPGALDQGPQPVSDPATHVAPAGQALTMPL
jgi:Bacterial alpha-L-rhamnosidase 6 hairpin glycosidase domain